MTESFARTVLTVRPQAFGPDAETAASNAFQHELGETPADDVRAAAIREYDGLVATLEDAGIDVLVIEDTPRPVKPDAVFPNNWVSFHGDGHVILYPMATAGRAAEVRRDVLATVEARMSTRWSHLVDLTGRRRTGEHLEGTGSLVLDRVHDEVWAALSSRTDAQLAAEVAARLGLRLRTFETRDGSGLPIYHTNVVLALGAEFAVVCGESIVAEERGDVLTELAAHRELIDISAEQAAKFCGNVLELRSREGAAVLALSASALDGFSAQQRSVLERTTRLAAAPIPTIERHGGGSVRCMLAEVFPPDEEGAHNRRMHIDMVTTTPEETLAAGERLGRAVGPRAVILLEGEMGAGKTVFTKGVFAGRGGDPTEVVSPSYTLVNVYHDGDAPFHHVDLYRLENPEHLLGLEYEEFLYHERGVTVVEWPRTTQKLLEDDEAVKVTIVDRGDAGRLITVEAADSRYPDLAEGLAC